MKKTTTRWMVLATALFLVLPALAVDPPGLMNYQGVLRDADDRPLDGAHDMVFRFYDDEDPADPENEIFVDEHLVSGTGAVAVTGGLFDVLLGSGNFYDGTGPGDHPHIFYVFALHETVYLEVQVGTETLQPRMQVVSAPYAINAVVLGGYTPSEFINTTSEEQEKIGLLRASGGVDFGGGADDDLTAGDVTGLTKGPGNYADFLHSHGYADNADTVDNKHAIDFADAVHGHPGSDITSPVDHAANAERLEGRSANQFLDVSGTTQTKYGELVVNATDPNSGWGITGSGHFGGAFFSDLNGSGLAKVGFHHSGIDVSGDYAGGQFTESDTGAYARIASDSMGIWAFGQAAGGHFQCTDGTGYARVAQGDTGIFGTGSSAGGQFEANGGTGRAWTASGDTGIEGWGDSAGGVFLETGGGTGAAYLATSNRGMSGYGDVSGGLFGNSAGNAIAELAHRESGSGELYGISASGDSAGGYFKQTSGTAEAYLGYHEYGIWAEGQDFGGYFKNIGGGSGEATLAASNTGIWAEGDGAAGQFTNYSIPGSSATASIAINLFGSLYGIIAEGEAGGGFFSTGAGSGQAYLGYGDRGLWATGSFSGGTFSDTIPATGVWSDLAMMLGDPPTAYKITGSGQVSFVQNHPYDPNRVVVYSAPEGDETAVYTRGTAGLVAGEARIALGETFRWVANPDIGLTAYLTPHGDCLGLYVESLSTDELVVRELGGGTSDVVFDYIVYGLRIGFEKSNVVQTKFREAPLPASEMGEEFYSAEAAREALTALGRFKRMTADVRGVETDELDLGGAVILREAIRASDWQQIGREPIGGGEVERSVAGVATGRPAPEGEIGGGAAVDVMQQARLAPEDESTEPASPFTLFPLSEEAEVGDVLVLDSEQPGHLRRADTAGDPNVVGIVAEEPMNVDGQLRAGVALYGLVSVKADAAYGIILAGDLLATSPTPGHAALAVVPTPGTVIGKALEPLESGTGGIQILVMPR